MKNILFYIVVVYVAAYCGWQFATAIGNLDKRVSQTIAEANRP